MAERAVRSAARRRERWLRSMWRHEQLSVRMAVATASHHSWKSHAVVGTQTEYAGVADPVPVTEYVAPAHAVAPFSSPAVSFEMPAPVVEYVAHAPAVTYAAPALVVGYVSSAPAVTFAAHAPVIDYVAPASSVTYAAPAPVSAPVFEFIAPAPAVSFVAPSHQLRTAYTATGVNLDAAVEVSASQVVGSLPLGEVFAAPVFHQVHHEQRAGGDTTEIFANFTVVQEQGVVGSLPPVEEFRGGHHLLLRCGHLYAYSGMLWSSSQTLLPWSRFWTVLSRRWWHSFSRSSVFWTRSYRMSEFLSRSQRNSWWKCRPS